MTAEATLRQRLRRAFTQNLGLKLFSLGVSVALFTVVHGSETGQRSFQVPVVAILPPPSSGKVLVGSIPDKVNVKLSGSQSVLNSIRSLEAVQIDLTDASNYYYFEPSLFGLPAGIEAQVTPSTLTLDWESRLERRLAVRAQLSGFNDPDLEIVGEPVVTPSELMVSGPRSTVERLQDLATEPISVAGLGPGTHRRRVPLLPLPESITVSDPGEVTVEFTIETRKEQRRLRRLNVMPLGVSGAVIMRPEHVDVIVAAPERTLRDLDPEHVVPVVDLSNVDLASGAVSVPVQVRGLPEGMRIVRTEPSEVLVRHK